jgi:hypothetical protein
MILALGLALAAVASLPGGAERDAHAGTRAPTVLRIGVDRDPADTVAARTIRLRCTSSGDPSRGCRILRRLPRDVFEPWPSEICLERFYGPQEARVRGRLRGRPIDVRFARHDSCWEARWQQALPLLRLTGALP